MRSIILDFETTGLLRPSVIAAEHQPRPIEFGGIVVEDGKIVAEHGCLIDPQKPLDAEITKITGITNEMLVGAPTFETALLAIEPLFVGCDQMIAHNAEFDRGILFYALQRAGRHESFPWPRKTVCTIEEYRHKFGRRMKLTQLYEHFVHKPLVQTHRALDDVKALHEALVAAGFNL